MIIPISCTFLALLAAPTLEQDSTLISPCPDVFSYEPAGSEPGRWYGEVNLSTVRTLHSLWLNIVLDNKADILGNFVGKVSTKDQKNFKIENTTMRINPGSAVPVRFFVQFNPLNKTPKLVTIRLNGREICNANTPHVSRPIELEEGVERQLTQTPNFGFDASPRPYFLRSRATEISLNSSQCGKVVLDPIPLVVKGTPTLQGQWPWHIALYKTQGVNIMYICGGSLVTHKHVITAAHCVTRKASERHVDPNTLMIILGKHNLMTSVEGVQIKLVKKIIVNPNYNPSLFSRDVAILELREPVTYSDYVRPACLWPDNEVELKNVIGKNGSVVGWGLDETRMSTEELTMVEMPVVSHETCIESYSEFYLRFTSDYTYCAGYINGSSVCNGDSGGGMVFRINGIWYLRGLVSLASSIKCEMNYIVFTDLAKLLPWIHATVSNF